MGGKQLRVLSCESLLRSVRSNGNKVCQNYMARAAQANDEFASFSGIRNAPIYGFSLARKSHYMEDIKDAKWDIVQSQAYYV